MSFRAKFNSPDYYDEADNYLSGFSSFSGEDPYGFMSAEGPGYRDGFSSANGSDPYDFMSAGGPGYREMGDEFGSANGLLRDNKHGVSQPYTIRVVNASANTLTCTLFGAEENISSSVTNFGNSTALTLSVLQGPSYVQLLFQTISNPFNVGMMYVNSANTTQVTTNYTLRYRDGSGNQANKPIVARLDPYQNLNTVLPIFFAYKIDGRTDLQFTMQGSATVDIDFYPSETLDLFRLATGNPIKKQYRGPNIIKATPVARLSS